MTTMWTLQVIRFGNIEETHLFHTLRAAAIVGMALVLRENKDTFDPRGAELYEQFLRDSVADFDAEDFYNRHEAVFEAAAGADGDPMMLTSVDWNEYLVPENEDARVQEALAQ